MAGGRRVHIHRSGWLLIAAVSAVAVFMALVAAMLAYNVWQDINRSQPLSVTACTPDSYDAPAGHDEGPPQDACDSWFADGTPAEWPAGEPISVAGQVCNSSDRTVAYQVTVAFESVTTKARYPMIDTPISYEPGCQRAYRYDFEFPGTAWPPEDGTYGRWRLVGRAVPVDDDRFAELQWDAAKTVEFVE